MGSGCREIEIASKTDHRLQHSASSALRRRGLGGTSPRCDVRVVTLCAVYPVIESKRARAEIDDMLHGDGRIEGCSDIIWCYRKNGHVSPLACERKRK